MNDDTKSVNGRVGQQFSSEIAGRSAGFLLGPAPINDDKLSAAMSIRKASGFGRTFAKASAPKSKSGRAAQFRRNCIKQAGIPQALRLAMSGRHEYSQSVRFRPDLFESVSA